MLSVIILLVVFILIAVRQIGSVKLKIWQIMLFGAVFALLSGEISPVNALSSINFDVILFLFGMFAIGAALEESGYLSSLSSNFFRKAKSTDQLILLILFGIGLASAFLMNDTLAIIGTPLVLHLARKHGIAPKPLLLTLAFAVTIGSVMSPIGNPQNLLIAINGNMANPFIAFLEFLLVPTAINLFATYLLLKIFYKNEFRNVVLNHSEEHIKDKGLAELSKISLIMVVSLVLMKMIIVVIGYDFDIRLTYIALLSAIPVLLFSQKRMTILKKIDWQTLVFFASMFVLMQSVWDTGFFQNIITELKLDITSTWMILAVSVVLSQLISNVPLVALYLPLLLQAGAGTREMIALAAGSTIAGNMLILGAASNVIIIQNAEKHGETITFMEFAKVGVPLTIINVIVYWVFLGL